MKRGMTLLIFLFMLVPRPAVGEPKPLSDEELDQVTAQGVQFKLKMMPDEQLLEFNFDMGSTFGTGSVAPSPFLLPSSLVINGNPNLGHSTFFAENLILNLNVCVQCQATTIVQQGFGFPITVTFSP